MFSQKRFHSMLLVVSLFMIIANFCGANMIAGWTFDEGGGNTAKDVTGNGHNGTVSSPKWVTGKIGGALEFNGDGDRVIVPNHEALNIKNELTLEAWVYPKGWNSELNCVVQKWKEGGLYQYLLSVYQQNNKSYISTNGSNWPSVQGKMQIPINQWTHLATTYDGKKLRVYVNGKLDNETDLSGAIFISNAPLLIGGYGPKTPECSFGWNRHFKGIIDEVRVWDTALSEAVIAANMSKSTAEIVGGIPPTQEIPGEFTLAGTDPNETPTIPNINQVFVKSDSNKLYFKVTSHKNWSNNITLAIFLDKDQNPNTGLQDAGMGADYQILFYMEAGELFGGILIHNDAKDKLENTNGEISDAILSPNSNTIEFGVKLSDIGNPKAVDFVAVMFVTQDVVDLAPDNKFYTYKLGSGTQPTGGMVLYLPFDEGNGSIVKDLSGYGNNGVTKGKVEWTQGIKGTALSFSKDWKGHVEVPDNDSLDITQQITMSAWIKPYKLFIGNNEQQRNCIFDKDYSYYMEISDAGKLSFWMYGVNPQGWLSGNTDMTRLLNTWVHVAAVYDGQEKRVYVNGKLDASVKASGNIIKSNTPLTVGWVGGTNRYFDGIIDEVKIWSRALTGNEIADLANIGSTPIVCDGPVSTKGPSKDPVLMGTDPDDSQEANLNQISAYSSNNKIYFSVSTYKTIGDNFSISVSMDIDQNKKTGHVESYGADYAIDFGMEDGKLFNELWVWDKNKGEWVKTNSDVSYVPPILPGNIFFFNVNLKDINNPKVIDFLTTMAIKKSGKWTVIDNSPDKCYYRYNLGENQIPSVSRNLIIPEVSGAPGKSVTVPINISDASGVAGGDINVIYDPKVLKITEIKPTVLSASMNLVSNTNTSGKIILRLAGTNAITSGNGSLIDMIFTIDASAAVGTETPVRFESAEVFDANGNNIVIGTQNGKVKVISDCVKGDVNGDGSIKSNDAILTLRISAGLLVPTDQQLCAADYNNDKQVKSNDAILILRKSADLIAPEKGPIVSGNRNINVTLDRIYGAAGQSITVPFRVDNSQILAGGDIQVVYNSSVLRATEVFSDEKILLVGNVSEPGVIRIAFAIAESLRRETIAYIKFDIISDYSSPLSIKRHELYDCYGVLLDSKAIDKDFISYNLPPEDSLLLQNFPNPFNPDTWIPYQINENSEVVIWILNTKGEVVRKLDLGNKQAGLYITQDRAAYWDGKDDSGNPVASGVYFYSIKAGKLWDTKKMIVVK